MIINSITLNNFRQFKGLQTLDLSNTEDKNVTVIYGENGRGKTGIYRALILCLFGQNKLEQDTLENNDNLNLINIPALKEKKDNPTEMFVKIDFSHKDINYILERKYEGIIHNESIIENIVSLKLTIKNQQGKTHFLDDINDIQKKINKIIDPGLQQYFLFDGEKIEKITRADKETKKEISRAIRSLLNIDNLEKSIRAFKKLIKYYDNEIKNSASEEIERVIIDIENNEKEQELLKQNISQNENEIHMCSVEIDEIDKKLDEIKEIKELLSQRKELEEALNYQNQISNNSLDNMKNYCLEVSKLISKKTINNVFDEINEKFQKKEIPSQIRSGLIDKIIQDEICICGNPVKINSEELNKLIEWKARIVEEDTEDSILKLWQNLGKINDQYSSIDIKSNDIIENHKTSLNKIYEINSKLDFISKEIGSERADASDFESQRDRLHQKHLKLINKIEDAENEIIKLTDEYKQLLEKRRLIEIKQGVNDELTKRVNITRSAKEALENIFLEFTGETRDKLGLVATKYFLELLDDQGKQILKQIIVKNDYSLEVLYKWDEPFLINFSAGQRQIMSISFIAALASETSENILEMPLFMDTPFGRLSNDHRKNVIDKVPNWCSQWIFLATDTEFTTNEFSSLQDTGKWGKFYYLQSREAGFTEIKSMEPSETRTIIN